MAIPNDSGRRGDQPGRVEEVEALLDNPRAMLRALLLSVVPPLTLIIDGIFPEAQTRLTAWVRRVNACLEEAEQHFERLSDNSTQTDEPEIGMTPEQLAEEAEASDLTLSVLRLRRKTASAQQKASTQYDQALDEAEAKHDRAAEELSQGATDLAKAVSRALAQDARETVEAMWEAIEAQRRLLVQTTKAGTTSAGDNLAVLAPIIVRLEELRVALFAKLDEHATLADKGLVELIEQKTQIVREAWETCAQIRSDLAAQATRGIFGPSPEEQ